MLFDVVERNGRFGRIQCQRGKESSSRGKKKRRIFLCRRTVRVKVEGKSSQQAFRKLKKGGCLLGRKTGERERKGQIEELVGDHNPGAEAPPRSKRGGSKGNVRGGATARGVM